MIIRSCTANNSTYFIIHDFVSRRRRVWGDNLKDSFSEPSSFINADLPLADLAKRYLQAMLTREQKKGRDLVMDAVESGQSIKDIYSNVFQPVMYEIGRLWQIGAISVGQEHYCSNATQVTMSMLYPRLFTGVSHSWRVAMQMILL